MPSELKDGGGAHWVGTSISHRGNRTCKGKKSRMSCLQASSLAWLNSRACSIAVGRSGGGETARDGDVKED